MTSVQDWAAPNPVTENRSGVIGKGVDRYEGALKVTGTAPYAYDTLAPSPPAIGVLVTATIPRGKVTAVDTAAAEAAPGAQLWLVDPHGNLVLRYPAGSKGKAILDDLRYLLKISLIG